MAPLGRRIAAELMGTAFLLVAIVGSGIMAERLTTDPGLQLLQNAFATAGALTALILAFGPVSGAHLNPAVTLADRALGGLTNREAAGYIAAQVAGGIIGVAVANLMFDLPAVTWSTTDRWGTHLWLAEVVATIGLLYVILGLVRSGRSEVTAFAVGAYIAGAFYFTSSTSFANPAVTIGRMLSDTFAGIAPASVTPFVLAELAAVVIVVASVRRLFPGVEDVADQVVVPHSGS